MGLDNYTGVMKVAYGNKLLIGPNYSCAEIKDLPADVVISVSDSNTCPKIDRSHFHYDVKNKNNSNSRSNYKMSIEHIRDLLLNGKTVLVHAPERERAIVVMAGALYLTKSYESFEDALYHLTKKLSAGKSNPELIQTAQTVLYDKK